MAKRKEHLTGRRELIWQTKNKLPWQPHATGEQAKASAGSGE